MIPQDLPIVGIGASAGGLDPIRKLLKYLPIDTGMAFVVIQHLASGQESMLPEILSRSTKMKVQQVEDGMKVKVNQVYVITPGTTMTLNSGSLKLVPKGVALKPINDFLISIASERKTHAIGIVLSGTGNDGTEGLKAIKAEGGITFAQDPDTAQYPDMPKNAIAAETPDFVLSPEQIVKELVRIAKHPQLTRSETKAPEQEKVVETELKKIVKMLKTSFGVDFTHYRETTVNRRITRRMVLNKTENIKGYVEFLRTQPSEMQALFDDLLIGVTSFFREPETFSALTEKIFPELLQNRSPNELVRVWVPGCSTGEEVYSIAIAIQEFTEKKDIADVRIQIFGTDANEKNIEKARQGIYPKSIEDKVSENRLQRFFTSENGHYRITKPIRNMCIFAKQDITTDPPFSNIDLIMCRNVLIYFDEHLHERVIPIFHYGLKPNGFLVIGESESVGKFQYLFEPTTPKGLIYRKKQAQPNTMLYEEAFMPHVAKNSAKPSEKAGLLTVLGEKVDHLITTEYGPATLLVNNNLDILVFRGDVAPYLSPESGVASLNVTKIIRKELRSQVQTAVYRAKKEKRVFKEKVRFKQKGQTKTVNIEIRPLETAQYDEPFYLVLFTDATSHDAIAIKEIESVVSPIEAENLKDRQISELKEDLEATKQSLQTIVEGQEATNEELRSTMEEVQSSNEELQSTNEELETAKEELQSGNEELQTLNEELKNRNQTLGRLNDDLANLQTNIDLPVIIVDNNLKIRRFTSSAQELLQISPSDVGQPITNVSLRGQFTDLEKTITDVITKLKAVNHEVIFAEDHFCEMRVRPYLTEEKKIDGAVLSFVDITDRKKVEEEMRKSELILENSSDSIIITDLQGKITSWNKGAAEIFGYTAKDMFGESITKLAKPDEKDQVAPAQLETIRKGQVFSGEWEGIKKDGSPVWLILTTMLLKNSDNEPTGMVGFGKDVTRRKKAEEKLEEYKKNLEKLVEERTQQLKDSERLATIGATAGMVGHDIRNPLQAITSDVFLAKADLASMPQSKEKNDLQESLEEIEQNVSYINKIVVDLQDFARPLTPKLEEVDIEKTVHLALANLNIPENVTVKNLIGRDVPKLKTDQSYLQRILINLANNAIQAMPNGGKLTIAVAAKNGKAIITIEDNGEGIPENVKSKLFIPLMTTKAKGQGFGLSVVKKFTEALDGTVKFESEVGKGSKFIIELPA
jgi:two-component system, chemotaxis family, CheB/CheR fusion protein